jgi:hypothetical protein
VACKCTFSTIIHLPKGLICGPEFFKITEAGSMNLNCIRSLIKKEKAELQYLKRWHGIMIALSIKQMQIRDS